jgi:hypothetical protein
MLVIRVRRVYDPPEAEPEHNNAVTLADILEREDRQAQRA